MIPVQIGIGNLSPYPCLIVISVYLELVIMSLIPLYEQDNLPGTTLLPKHVCLSRIAQRQTTTDRQDELAVSHVIRKLT
jgi:hypothetical protein